MARQVIAVKLTPAQVLRMEALGKCYWPTETLESSELARRLLLEYLLWKGDEKGLVERTCPIETSHKPSKGPTLSLTEFPRARPDGFWRWFWA